MWLNHALHSLGPSIAVCSNREYALCQTMLCSAMMCCTLRCYYAFAIRITLRYMHGKLGLRRAQSHGIVEKRNQRRRWSAKQAKRSLSPLLREREGVGEQVRDHLLRLGRGPE